MNRKIYHVYFMASISKVLYLGVTGNIQKRVCQHKNKLIDGFSKKYQCTKLIYFEEYNNINQAIAREKQLKSWRREKKEDLINKLNPSWKDLSN